LNKSRIKKIVERILRKPPEFMLSDILKVAEYFGWEYVECKGSHFKLTKSMRRPIVGVVHKGKVKRAFLIDFINALDLEEWYEENKN